MENGVFKEVCEREYKISIGFWRTVWEYPWS